MCNELYIIICWSEKRESVPKEIKYRWIKNTTKHLPNVKIILIEDSAALKEDYDSSACWEIGAKDIKAAIKKPIDVVFCGSDYLNTNRFESLYPESTVHYFDRKEIPISSTNIRNWAMKYWDYIPNVCKSYYVKKILIIGGESTGKSTLAHNLALAYNTNFVSEVGRDTCEYAGGEEYMIAEDLYENLLKQKINTEDALKTANKLLFVDTDCLTTLFYSNLLIENNIKEHTICKDLAESINNTNKWDLVIFLAPNVEFIQDGTRNEEIRSNREKYSDEIEALFKSRNINYVKISESSYVDRFESCKKIINKICKFDPE